MPSHAATARSFSLFAPPYDELVGCGPEVITDLTGVDQWKGLQGRWASLARTLHPGGGKHSRPRTVSSVWEWCRTARTRVGSGATSAARMRSSCGGRCWPILLSVAKKAGARNHILAYRVAHRHLHVRAVDFLARRSVALGVSEAVAQEHEARPAGSAR
jgi:hypothetical protein